MDTDWTSTHITNILMHGWDGEPYLGVDHVIGNVQQQQEGLGEAQAPTRFVATSIP